MSSTTTTKSLFTAPLLAPKQLPVKQKNKKYDSVSSKLYDAPVKRIQPPDPVDPAPSLKPTKPVKPPTAARRDDHNSGVTFTNVEKHKQVIDIFNYDDGSETLLDNDIDLSVPSDTTISLDHPITVEQLSAVANLQRITTVNLSCNKVDAVPHVLQQCVQLKQLDLSINSLTHIHTADVKQYAQLTDLNLSYNQLTRLDIDFSMCLYQLQRLQLDHNQLTVLPSLANATSLRTLHVTHNLLTSLPSLPASLTLLNAAHNNLTSVTTVGSCSKLTELYLSHNSISTLPPLQQLVQLEEFDVSCNQLTGLPSLSHTKLTTLNVAHNQLTSISALPTTVADLNVSHNQICDVGTLATCTHLETLQLSFNNLSDTAAVLHTVSQLKALIELDISNNECDLDVSMVCSLVPSVQVINGVNVTAPTSRPTTASQHRPATSNRPMTSSGRPTTSAGRPVLVKPVTPPAVQLQRLNANDAMQTVLLDNSNVLSELQNKVSELLEKSKLSLEKRGVVSTIVLPSLPAAPTIDTSTNDTQHRPVTSSVRLPDAATGAQADIEPTPVLESFGATMHHLKAASFRQSLLQSLFTSSNNTAASA